MRYKNKILGSILLFFLIVFINIGSSIHVQADQANGGENNTKELEITDQLKANTDTHNWSEAVRNLNVAEKKMLEETNTDDYTSEPVNLTEIGINPTNISSVENLGGRIMRFLNLTIFGVSLLGVLYGGFTLMTAAGKDDRINLGKDVLKYSIAGMVVTLAAYLIVTLVQSILYSLAEF